MIGVATLLFGCVRKNGGVDTAIPKFSNPAKEREMAAVRIELPCKVLCTPFSYVTSWIMFICKLALYIGYVSRRIP